MNEKGTAIETSSHIPLTSVQSGIVCKLIGVSDVRPGRGKHGKHKGRFGRIGKHQEHIEHKKKWHERGQRQIVKRLLDLGLTKGCTFKVVLGRGRGPVLVEVRGTRIALGHGLASKVIVEVLEGAK
ncbi:MAG: FeoA family protein [Candidatus Thorarchaeota archaeon]|jgi:ferrous iron transport protein A